MGDRRRHRGTFGVNRNRLPHIALWHFFLDIYEFTDRIKLKFVVRRV